MAKKTTVHLDNVAEKHNILYIAIGEIIINGFYTRKFIDANKITKLAN